MRRCATTSPRTSRRGDLFALNDPYFGGSHLPDITVIQPIFYEGKLLFYAVNRAHHSDIGGGTHGGYNPAASEIFHEGLRIPPLRLYDGGEPRRDLLQMLAANGRHPEGFLGDLNAQIGSVNIAARRMRALLDAYGTELLLKTVQDILEATERHVRGFISDWPDGVYRGESFVDDDGFDSKLIPIRATVTIKDDGMTIDLSESHTQVTGFINSVYANTRSLAHAAIMYMAPSDVAKNEGSMRPVDRRCAKGADRQRQPAGACLHEHESLRRGGGRGDIQGDVPGRARRGQRRLSPVACATPSRASTRGPAASSSGTSSWRAAAEERRRGLTDGPTSAR